MRSPHRIHDRASFFKYTKLSTALSVIESQSLRWSAPSCFNDPFDVPRAATVDFSLGELREACDAEFARLVMTGAPTLHPRIRQIQSVLSLQLPETRKEIIEEVLASQRIADPPSTDAFETLAEIWLEQVGKLRILCTSEINDSSSMWDRYADAHKGVVLELACLDELDSALLVARPVTYRDEPPKLPDAKFWAKAVTLQPDTNFSEIWSEYFYVKHSDWRSEREWRVVTFADESEEGDFSYYPLDPKELIAVYIGYQMEDKDASMLIQTLQRAHAHVRVYRAVLDRKRGRITFAEWP